MNAVVDFPVKPEARPYLEAFDRGIGQMPDRAQKSLVRARRRAMTRFAETGFPGRKSESWRYFDLRPLERAPLLPAERSLSNRQIGAARDRLAALDLPRRRTRLVIVDGGFAAQLSALGSTEGVSFGSTGMLRDGQPELIEPVVDAVSCDAAHPFAALNAALFLDGYVLDIAPGVALDEPVEILHLASGAVPASFHTRSLINLGEGSRASVIETYVGEGRYWRNDVVAARLGEGAQLSRTVLVEEGIEATHLALFGVRLAARARLDAFVLLLGGHRVRQEADVRFDGEGASCEINGGFLVAGDDEANFVTAIDHAAPGCRTDELVKGVAAGRGHGAFQGRIAVRKDAQKTDAHQLSRNLLIGRRAVIDTKPELEIDADDVKCSHGASVGDLDERALFYLRSRGIPAEEARHMLIEGFLSEPVETAGDEELRAYLLRRLAARLAALED